MEKVKYKLKENLGQNEIHFFFFFRLILPKFFPAKDEEALYNQQKQDQVMTVTQIMNFLLANFRLKLKKIGKLTRPFRYDLHKIP